MAVVLRDRRQLNLRLPLPETGQRGPARFPSLPRLAPTSTASSNWSSFGDFEKLQVLGHGSGGTVYKVRHKRTSSVYALKVVRGGDSDPDIRRQIFREISILQRAAESPHVVKCHGMIGGGGGGDMGILMEYMDQGTLGNLLLPLVNNNNMTAKEKEETIARVAKQVLQGLEHLHSHCKIAHRDIKPSNLLVNKDMVVKIADFGVSKMMCRSLEPCNSYVGTCAYMSPERFDPQDHNGGNYNGYAADIWSLGLTVLELYMGHFPLLPAGQRPDWATLMCAICFGGDPPSPPNHTNIPISAEFRDFVDSCLQKDAAKRSTASQLLCHPFLTTTTTTATVATKSSSSINN